MPSPKIKLKNNRNRRVIDVDLDLDIRTIDPVDWPDFEDMYRDAIDQISVPPDFKPYDIHRINSLVDQIYSQARFDHSYAKRQSAKYNRRLANAKKTLKLTFKKKPGQTADERDALMTQYLISSPLPGDKTPIMTLVETWEDRLIFMDAVLDVLTKISDKMLTGNGALKLDARGRGDDRG